MIVRFHGPRVRVTLPSPQFEAFPGALYWAILHRCDHIVPTLIGMTFSFRRAAFEELLPSIEDALAASRAVSMVS